MAINQQSRKPGTEHYDAYQRLVLEGKTDDEIRTVLKLSKHVYEKYQPQFLMHFREHVRQAFRDKPSPSLVPLTDRLRKKFLGYMSNGLGVARAAAMLNVPLPCVMDGWFKEDPLFQEEARYAAERAAAEVEMALHRSAVGFEHGYTIENESRVEGIGNNGPVDKTTTTKTSGRKKVYPNVRAQELWLINRDPDRWKTKDNNPDDAPPPQAVINVYGDDTGADVRAFVETGRLDDDAA